MQVKDLIVTGDAKILGNLYTKEGNVAAGGGGGASGDSGVTYRLSKSGSTITLTGSDGSTSSVTDANTDTNTTYGEATTSAAGLMSAADKSKLNGIAAGANNYTYTHPSTHPASMITGLAKVATSGSYNDLSNKPTIPTVPSSLPANGGNADTVDNKHASDFMAAANPTGTGAFSLNRKSGTEVASYSFAEGKNTEASGEASHAEGCDTVALYYYDHAEGYQTSAEGWISHAEGDNTTASGMGSHAEGENTTASNSASHAEGENTTASGIASHAEGLNTTASNIASHAQGKFNKAMTAGGSSNNTIGDAFVIGNGTSTSARSNAFRVTYTGATYGLSSFNSSGADYAEFFEWVDGNIDNEDRVGYFVTLDGEKICKAQEGDYILGIVSGNPCIIGNADEDWLNRWEKDDFGRFIKEDVITKATDRKMVEIPVYDAEGNQTEEMKLEMREVETDEIITGWRYKQNQNYDNTQTYIERKDRKEWDCIGMLGVLSVWDDGTCEVNGYCKATNGGIATKANTGYRVIKRVNKNIVKVIFR